MGISENKKTTGTNAPIETEKSMLTKKNIAVISDTSSRLKLRKQSLKYEEIASVAS